jgi:hypothetical protein
MKALNFAIGLAAFIASGGASANTVWCSPVSIQHLGINAAAQVYLDVGAGTHLICTIGSDSNGVSGNACSAMYATLLSARAQGKTITLQFSSSYPANAGIGSNCDVQSLGTWVARPPSYLSVNP